MSRRQGKGSQGGLVYSTEFGRMCPRCRRSNVLCVCDDAKGPSAEGSSKAGGRAAGDGVVRLERQTKGRKGKGVTIIRGVPLPASELAQLGKRLKKMCGSGGTIKDGVIEIQGDHRDRLLDELSRLGWKVKKAGG